MATFAEVRTNPLNPVTPGHFYGRSLPRPRFYSDGKYERVDPPPCVNDSFLRWAADAHWSMGGSSYKRHRMQGKIEGRSKNLRDESEDSEDGKQASKKLGGKSKGSSGKPRASRKAKSVGVVTPNQNEIRRKMKERSSRGMSLSPVIGKTSPTGNSMGKLSEEDGPSPARVAPSALEFPDSSIDPASPPPSSCRRAFDPPGSMEYPVHRRRAERSLPLKEDSDSDINLEEFLRYAEKPTRRSSRVRAIGRRFTEFVQHYSSDNEL